MSWLRVRDLRPGEVAGVRAVFDGLSATSRWRRFHTELEELAPRLLRRLADVGDGRQVALVAEVRGCRQQWEPVGIARFVRDAHDTAEIAIAVVDREHGRGIGRRLLTDLVERARAEGVERIHGDLLADNRPVRALLQSVLPAARFRRHGAVVRMTADLVVFELSHEDLLGDLVA